MAAPQRIQISVSLFKPLVVVDVIEGSWFAVVSDGTAQFEVTEWPHDCELLVDDLTVLQVDLYTADDADQFLRGEGRMFAEVYIPVSEVRLSKRGLFRTWFGLQRGCHLEEVCAESVAERYQTSVMLAKNLLTPKICCSVVPVDLPRDTGTRSLGNDVEEDVQGLRQWSDILRQSVVQHSTIVTNLHRQLCTLWTKGKLVCAGSANGDFAARLTDVNLDSSALQDSQADCNGEVVGNLQDEVSRLTDGMIMLTSRLEESNQLKLSYRERLVELTGEQLEEGDSLPVDEAPEGIRNLQALQRENRQLSQALQAERACARQRDLEALRPAWSQHNADLGEFVVDGSELTLEQVQHRHAEELNHLVRIHTAEVDALRAIDRDQRKLTQDLQRKNESLGRETMRKETEVIVLQQEVRDQTARLVEAWKGQSQTVPWDGQVPPATALSLAELEAARREVEQLRQRLITSEEAANSSTLASASGSRPRNVITERARGLLQDLHKDTGARVTERERLFSREVENLVSLTERLQRERDGSRAASDEHCRRCEVAEKRAEHLQREVDQAAGEAMLKAGPALDQEWQELRGLRAEAPTQRRGPRQAPERSKEALSLLGTELLTAREAEAVAEGKLKAIAAAHEVNSEARDSAGAEINALRDCLRSRTVEHAEEVQRLKQCLEVSVDSRLRSTEAQTHEESLRRRDVQQGRQLDLVYDELRQEMQARHEAEAKATLDSMAAREASLPFERKATAIQAELAKQREAEAALRSELQDLEDVNCHMSEQNQRQLEDFNLMQERINREVRNIKKEKALLDRPMPASDPAELAQLRQENRSLHVEVEALRSEFAGERLRRNQAQMASAEETERRVAQLKAQFTAAGVSMPVGAHSFLQEATLAASGNSSAVSELDDTSLSSSPSIRRHRPIEGVWGVENALQDLMTHSVSGSHISAVSEQSKASISHSNAVPLVHRVGYAPGVGLTAYRRVAAPPPVVGEQPNGLAGVDRLGQLRSQIQEASRQVVQAQPA